MWAPGSAMEHERCPALLLLSGFLGSGKTTLLNRLLHRLDADGRTAAVIENEIGDVGIDDRTVEGRPLQVTPLFGGCVCCQINSSFVEAVQEISAQLRPDWILTELTGLAVPENLRDSVRQYVGPEMRVRTVCVVDGARMEKLFRVCGTLLRGQLAGADLVVLNKASDPRAEDLNTLSELAGGAPVYPVADLDDPRWPDLLRRILS